MPSTRSIEEELPAISLADGWAIGFSDEHRCFYYYNTSEGVTQWEAPSTTMAIELPPAMPNSPMTPGTAASLALVAELQAEEELRLSLALAMRLQAEDERRLAPRTSGDASLALAAQLQAEEEDLAAAATAEAASIELATRLAIDDKREAAAEASSQASAIQRRLYANNGGGCNGAQPGLSYASVVSARHLNSGLVGRKMSGARHRREDAVASSL